MTDLPSEECRLAEHSQCITDVDKQGENPNSQRALEQNLEVLGIKVIQPSRQSLRAIESMKRRLLIPN
jgi:hypothetical protein